MRSLSWRHRSQSTTSATSTKPLLPLLARHGHVRRANVSSRPMTKELIWLHARTVPQLVVNAPCKAPATAHGRNLAAAILAGPQNSPRIKLCREHGSIPRQATAHSLSRNTKLLGHSAHPNSSHLVRRTDGKARPFRNGRTANRAA
jgi:hypothetical protein